MGTVLVVLRVGLAAVFMAAGIGKLLDRSGSRQALIDFGVPPRLAPFCGIALPAVELAVAAGLLIEPSVRWAAGVAIALLIAFVAGISVALSEGRTPDCHCFGQIHSSPAGSRTLLRNVVLALVAGFLLVWGPGPAIDQWTGAGRGHAFILSGLVVVLLICLLVALVLARRSEARRQLLAKLPPGLDIGEVAPEFELGDLSGGRLSLSSLLGHGKPVLLVFTHEGCGPCSALMPDLARWQAALADKLTVAVIGGGEEEAHRSLKSEHGFAELLLQDDMEVFRDYKMVATPAAVLVSPRGLIDGASVFGSFAIEQLARLTIWRSDRSATDGASPPPVVSRQFDGTVVDPIQA